MHQESSTAQQFYRDLLLLETSGKNPDEEQFQSSLKVFVDYCKSAIALNADAEAAYFLGHALIFRGWTGDIFTLRDLRGFLTRFENTDHPALLWLMSHVFAADDDRPLAHWDNAASLDCLMRAGAAGDGRALFDIACRDSMATALDSHKSALAAAEDAVVRGCKSGLYITGYWYLVEGSPTGRDYARAVDFLEKALTAPADPYYRDEQVDAAIRFYLGNLYYEGKGVAANLPRALEYMRAALRDGSAPAADWLAFRHIAAEEQAGPEHAGQTVEAASSPMAFFAKSHPHAKAAAKASGFQPTPRKQIDHEFRDLVGLEKIRRALSRLVDLAEIQQKRRDKGLDVPPQSLHMVFYGRPGTGKSVVAEKLGRILKSATLLDKGHVVTVSRADLVGQYIGETAQKTLTQIEKARGGILLVDEAYTLSQTGSGWDFGPEAISTLMFEMERRRGEFVLVACGYEAEMKAFMDSNPGLASRFGYNFHFPDYSADELTDIFASFCNAHDYKPTENTISKVRSHFSAVLKTSAHKFGNARDVRTLFDKSVGYQSSRVLRDRKFSRNALMTLLPEDIASPHRAGQDNVTYLEERDDTL